MEITSRHNYLGKKLIKEIKIIKKIYINVAEVLWESAQKQEHSSGESLTRELLI